MVDQSLAKLLEKSSQLIRNDDENFPRLSRSLLQTGKSSYDLIIKQQRKPKNFAQSEVLLARHGFDPNNLTQSLREINLQGSFELTTKQQSHASFWEYLKSEREKLVKNTLDAAEKKNHVTYRKHQRKKYNSSWTHETDQLKQQIGSCGRVEDGQDCPLVFKNKPLDDDMINYGSVIKTLTRTSVQEGASHVFEMNDDKRDDVHLVRRFREIGAEYMMPTWDLLTYIVANRNKQYDGRLIYLGNEYFTYKLGGPPDDFSDKSVYIDMHITRNLNKSVNDEDYNHCKYFFMLRCGLNYDDRYKKEFDGLASRIKQKSAPQARWERATEKFKHTVSLLESGKADYRDYPQDLLGTVEDFMWINLYLGIKKQEQQKANTNGNGKNNKNASNHYVISVDQYVGTLPLLMMIKVYLLAGAYERVVLHLIHIEECLVDGVHFAIALKYYNLLNCLDPNSPNLCVTTGDRDGFNFNLLIRQYVKGFWKANVSMAILYLYLLPKGQFKTELKKFSKILDTRDLDILFGVHFDSNIQPGILEADFRTTPADLAEIIYDCTHEIGSDPLKRLNLYDLASYYFGQSNRRSSLIECLFQMSQILINFSDDLLRSMNSISQARSRLPELQTMIRDFQTKNRDCMESNKDEDAFDSLQKNWIILNQFQNIFQFYYLYSLSCEYDAWMLFQSLPIKFEPISTFRYSIQENVPYLLLTAMECLFQLYNNSSDPEAKSKFRTEAQQLLEFASPLTSSSEVYLHFAKLELEMRV